MEKSTTKSVKETQDLGQHLAQNILASSPMQHAVVLALQGDLGAGKTTFLQGFAKGLGIKEIVNSPTFVIMKRFALKNTPFKNFYHLDLYRLNTPEEILTLDFEKIISNPENIVAIEWPEKLATMLPKHVIKITFGHLEEGKRHIAIDNS